MDIDRKPYTYLLHHLPTNTWYYGVKWKKGCHPDELWKTYFSSSNRVKDLRNQYGDNSFEFEIRHTFQTGKEAADWESKVLRRMRVLEKPDLWLNRTTNSAWLYEVHPLKGCKRPDVAKRQRENNSMKGKHGWGYGLTTKDDDRIAQRANAVGNALRGTHSPKQSEALLKKYADGWSPRKGKTHTAESKEKNRLAHIGKPSPTKGKTGIRRWITTGVDNALVLRTATIPSGWTEGRTL
jgi:Putative endonuclease segE, GIY-YIG domain